MTNSDTLAAAGTRPFPGPELAVRATGDPDPERFSEFGLRSVEDTRNALASIGRSLEDYEHILDFGCGCGCGRMLTWLEPLSQLGSRLYGTDTDADAVAWVRENLTFATTDVNGPLPPTSYEDGQFDLVYNHSVFTHLDEARQDAWLPELRRITRIGAHLVLTVHGEHAFAKYENAMIDGGGDVTAERELYSGHGLLFMPEEAWQAKGFPEWYGSAYHTTRYVFSHWTRWFQIKAYLPQGALGFQDVVVLERIGDSKAHGEYLRQPASGVGSARKCRRRIGEPRASRCRGRAGTSPEVARQRAGHLVAVTARRSGKRLAPRAEAADRQLRRL